MVIFKCSKYYFCSIININKLFIIHYLKTLINYDILLFGKDFRSLKTITFCFFYHFCNFLCLQTQVELIKHRRPSKSPKTKTHILYTLYSLSSCSSILFSSIKELKPIRHHHHLLLLLLVREMQSKIGSQGLPLCISAFTLSNHSLSTQIADHDRRREAMKTRTQRSNNMKYRYLEAIREGDLEDFVNETDFMICAAKAA
ncbi:hypothetical protein IC575_026863 [Cucumis melo]